MRLVVGLGNPGEMYENTRHNVGFMVLDAIASKVNCGEWMVDGKHNTQYTKNQSLLLAKPQTFMNDSGNAVKKLADFYKIPVQNIWIIHDDLDLKLGEYKIQKGIGPKVHNGVNSVEEKLGTKEFWRVRIGIDNRENRAISGEEYVLQKFRDEEISTLIRVVDRVTIDIKNAI